MYSNKSASGPNGARMPIIDIIAVTYEQAGPLQVLIQSFFNQTARNWRLKVIHDGNNSEFKKIMKNFVSQDNLRISYECTKVRHNDFGHSLRDRGLKSVSGNYVLITNGDNYYVPRFVELVSKSIIETEADVVMFDMVHSHNNPGGRKLPPYSYFQTRYRRRSIDIGAAVVRSELAKKAGFRDKTHDGDATYFEDIARVGERDLKIAKLNQVLFVHN